MMPLWLIFNSVTKDTFEYKQMRESNQQIIFSDSIHNSYCTLIETSVFN